MSPKLTGVEVPGFDTVLKYPASEKSLVDREDEELWATNAVTDTARRLNKRREDGR